MTVRMRTLAAFAAGAIVTPLLPFAASPAFAEGEATPPPSQSFADFCVNVPDDFEPFTDIDDNPFKAEIECLAFPGVTSGGPGNLPDDQYGPEIEVGRGQMATFVANVIDTANRLDTGENIPTLPPYDGSPAFSDIDGTTHEANISRLADAGIVNGGPRTDDGRQLRDDQYGPGLNVDRAQMATFINAALDFMTDEPGSTQDDYYTDDSDSVHESNINGITSLGISTGQGPDTYNPELSIDRDNMAVFLIRTLAELEERGDIGPATAVQDIQVSPDSESTLDAVANPDTDVSDDRRYTATGLVPEEEYRITLVEDSTIATASSSGETTFTDSDNDNLAEVGTRTADITTVNGEPAANNSGDGTATTPNDPADSGTAVGTPDGNGELTFVVDGDEDGEAIRPIVYRNGGEGNEPEDGGESPRLELNDDDTPAEPVDTGGLLTFTQRDEPDEPGQPGQPGEPGEPVASVTEFPDLVNAEFVRFTEAGTTIRYTFDEEVVAEVNEDAFFLFTFDGEKLTTDDDGDNDINDPNDALRDPNDPNSVLVVFPIGSEQFVDVTLATVERGAVEDSSGGLNPIGDEPIGTGVSFEAGSTDAPDLLSIDNFRESMATDTATLVDFTFDEDAFVVNPAAGQFQLVQPDGDDLLGTPVDNAATSAAGDFQGDGSTTITVSVQNEDTNEDGKADEPITEGSVVRGVVREGTVSDEAQVENGNELEGEPVEGNVNPLQVTDTDEGGTTVFPDLVSATIDEGSSTVTYVFDQGVVVVDAELFRVYDRTGAEVSGTEVSGRDSDPDDNTVIVVFESGSLDTVTGASVDEGAVRETGTGTPGVNQEDEVGTSSQPVASGSTTGPDLAAVNREVETETSTDPFTGETTTTVTGVTLRFIFDDEANLPSRRTMFDGQFFVINKAGGRFQLTGCEEANTTTVQGDDNVIVCDAPQDNDPITPGNQGEAQFVAARDAVLGVVQDRAVSDDEGTRNPEGGEIILGA